MTELESTESTSYEDNVDTTHQCIELPWPAFNKFFKCKGTDLKGNYITTCVLCRKSIKSSKTTSYNLKTHFEVSIINKYK